MIVLLGENLLLGMAQLEHGLLAIIQRRSSSISAVMVVIVDGREFSRRRGCEKLEKIGGNRRRISLLVRRRSVRMIEVVQTPS